MDLNDMAQIRDNDPQHMLKQVYNLPELIEDLLSHDSTFPPSLKKD